MISKKLIAVGAIVVVLLILVSIVWGSYNSLVSKDEGVKKFWGDVQVQYQRRVDLIPNLVNVVESYAGFEKSVITEVTKLRTDWQREAKNPDLEARVEAANKLESALSKLIFTAENYPDLKASQNFLSLQDSLAETENMVSTARTRFNEAVREYNTVVRSFPSNIIAGWFGFGQKTPFEAITAGAENAPKVDINIK